MEVSQYRPQSANDWGASKTVHAQCPSPRELQPCGTGSKKQLYIVRTEHSAANFLLAIDLFTVENRATILDNDSSSLIGSWNSLDVTILSMQRARNKKRKFSTLCMGGVVSRFLLSLFIGRSIYRKASFGSIGSGGIAWLLLRETSSCSGESKYYAVRTRYYHA